MWEIRLRTANFDDFKMLHLQATCETQNQRQEVYCAYLDDTRLFPFRGCARSKPQFLTAVPSLKLYRLTQVDVWMTRKLFNFGSVIHTLTSVYLSPLTTFHPTFPTVLTQPNSTKIRSQFDTVIQMINKGRSPNLRHVTRTHRVDLDCFFERVNLDNSILFKILANMRSVGGYFDKGNVHHDAMAFFVDFAANQTAL